MIGQHLLFRCKKGFYDNFPVAGFKTAAVSKTFAQLPKRLQKELNSEITRYAVLPDTVLTGNGKINRGILRISYFDDIEIVNRIFRVKDRCDYRGDVSFAHSYIIMDEDTDLLYSHPEVLTALESYDNYNDIDERCGGIASNNSIYVNDSLRFINNEEKYHIETIIDELNMNQKQFSQIITALSNRLSGDGAVLITVPGVDENRWNEEGGSLLGERLMTYFMKILPLCMKRFFSGVSYWNESLSFYGLDDIKFIIISKLPDKYDEKYYTVIDLKNPSEDQENETCLFGDYLWEIKNNPEKLAHFHDFIENSFGENVDLVPKLSIVMDTITQMYHYPQTDADEVQDILIELFNIFGNNMPMFDNIYTYFKTGIEYIAKNNKKMRSSLEKILLVIAEQYPNLIDKNLIYECFINNIYQGDVLRDTVEWVKKEIITTKSPKLFNFLETNVQKAEEDSISCLTESMFEVMLTYYQDCEKIDLKLYTRITTVLFRECENNEKNGSYQECLKIYKILLLSRNQIKSQETEELFAFYLKIYHCLMALMAKDRTLIEDIGHLLKQHLCMLGEEDFGQDYMEEYAFHVESELFFKDEKPNISVFHIPAFFEVFVTMLAVFIISKDFSEEWIKVYIYLLKQDYELYRNAAKYLEGYPKDLQGIGLYYIEIAKIHVIKQSSFKNIEKIISCFRDYDEIDETEKVYEIITKISNIDQFLEEMRMTDFIYEFYFYIVKKYNISKDQIFNLTEKYLSRNPDCMQKITEIAERKQCTEILQKVYFRIWIASNTNLSDSEMVESIQKIENDLQNKKYKDDIMSAFGEAFDDKSFQKSVIDDGLSKIISDYIYHGIELYHWDKKYKWSTNYCNLLKIKVYLDAELTDETFDFLLSKSGDGKNSEIYCFHKYIQRYLNDQSVKNEISEKNAFMGFILLLADGSSGQQCTRYLKFLGAEDDWRTPAYIMYGLYFIAKMKNKQGKFNQKLTESFVSKFEICINTCSEKNLLLCQQIYKEKVRNTLSGKDIQKFSKAAQKRKIPEIIEMFADENNHLKNKISNLFNRNNTKI